VSERNPRLEAADWLAALCDDSFEAAEARLLESWLAESKANRRAFATLTNNAGKFAAMAEVSQLKKLRTGALERMRARRPRAHPAVLAAVLIMAFVATGIFWELSSHTFEIETRLGQMTSVTLADGSIVEANTATHIRIHFDPLERSIHLLEGEANFRVQPQRWRPFIVRTSDLSVHALGTIFDVAELPHEARVIVSEGHVRVDTPASRDYGLVADQKLIYSRLSNATYLLRAQLNQDLAWRERRIRIDGRPLSELLREFARYSTTRVELADPELGSLSISGDFDPLDPGSFARAVAKLHSLAVSEPGPNRILLGPKNKD
jgi:transmembrane sensor